MIYLVTHGTEDIDEIADLDAALAHACQLIADSYQNVAIQDGKGNAISGDELVACCNGDKELTPDLRAN